MIIILGLFALFVVFFIGYAFTIGVKDGEAVFTDVTKVGLWIFAIALGIGLTMIPAHRETIVDEIVELEKARRLYIELKKDSELSEFTLTIIQETIESINKRITDMKNRASDPFTNWFYPQEALEIKLIK